MSADNKVRSSMFLCFMTILRKFTVLIMLTFQDLVNKKTKFFDGDSVTMIDYMICAFFERLGAFGLQR